MNAGRREAIRLRRLNAAYEIVGNPARRADYERVPLAGAAASGHAEGAAVPLPGRPSSVGARHLAHPRRLGGGGDAVAAVAVCALAFLAAVLLIPHVNVDLSSLSVVAKIVGFGSGTSQVPLNVTAAGTPAAATTLPAASAANGTTVTVSDPSPAPNTNETLQIRVADDGQPLASQNVWAIVTYHTTQERWPAAGTVPTDSSGVASIAFNTGYATPELPVQIAVYSDTTGTTTPIATTSFTPAAASAQG